MVRFAKSLSLKIILMVMSVEALIFIGLGSYYTRKFNNEIDRSLMNQIILPGTLMSQGDLSFNAVSDMETMESILHENYVNGMVIGLNGIVYYSLNPTDRDKHIDTIDGINLNKLFTGNSQKSIIMPNMEKGQKYLICFTPLHPDGKLVGFLYLKTNNYKSAAAKRGVAIRFALGSIISILLTSSVLIIMMHLFVTNRIHTLARVFNKFSEGDLDARARIEGRGDEIAMLAEDFNGLAAKLQETVARLTESESLLRGTFANAPFEFWVRDLEEHIIMQNDALVRHWGNLLGQKPEDTAISQEVLRIWKSNNKRAYAGEVVDSEVKFTFDGEERTFQNIIAPIRIDGEIKNILGINIDITQRKQIEESLRASEADLREAQKIARMGQWKLDLINNRLAWSAGIFSIFEIDQESFAASYEAFLEAIHPNDRTLVDNTYRDSVEKHQPYEIEHRLLMRDGRIKWVNEIGRTEYDNAGRPILSVGTVQDITKRKQTEEALKESEEKLRLMFEKSPIGMAMCEMDGTLVEANEAYLNIIGYTREECLKLTYWELTPKKYAEDEQKQLSSMEKTGRYGPYEKEYIRKSGEIAQVLLNGVLVTGADGVKRIWSLVEDITERKRAEEERTILEGQLRQAQKMESIGRLAGGVAHDFNNMLQTILGYSDLALEDAGPNTAVCESILEIQKAAKRSADLTRQLLAFARKQTINPKVIDLNDAVAGMLKMLQRLIGENIDLVWKPGKDLWKTKIDPSQMDQILANLSVNARDAITWGGNLTIETGNVVIDSSYCATHIGFIPGQYVMLAVSDNGAGMDKETVEHLFEPFFTTKEVGKGTGLGLATVYGIITQNHGFINVYSELGEGTTFKIYLPRTEASEEPEPEIIGAQIPHGNETVLIAEDEEAILRFGKTILEKCGYTVLAARTPGEALRLAQQHKGPIHLLVTDVVMPGMNGKQLSDKLLAIQPRMKTLYMSGYTANIIAHHGIIDANIEFLQKPFTVNTIAQRVRAVLETHRE